MKEITITIDSQGNCAIDVTGVKDNSCAKMQQDFAPLGKETSDRKKPEFYNQSTVLNTRGGR